MCLWRRFLRMRAFRKNPDRERDVEVEQVIQRARDVRTRAERLAAEARDGDRALWTDK